MKSNINAIEINENFAPSSLALLPEAFWFCRLRVVSCLKGSLRIETAPSPHRRGLRDRSRSRIQLFAIFLCWNRHLRCIKH